MFPANLLMRCNKVHVAICLCMRFFPALIPERRIIAVTLRVPYDGLSSTMLEMPVRKAYLELERPFAMSSVMASPISGFF